MKTEHKNMTYMRVCARIHLDAMKKNVRMMQSNLKKETKMCLVIKTDAYGHGAVITAKIFENMEGIWGFAVAAAQEALSLRRAGIQKPVLILGYVFPEHYPELIREEIRMAVFDRETAAALSEEACRQGKKALIHLAADTGMSRIGVPDSPEGVDIACSIAALPQVEIEGVFTHFARADERDKSNVLEAAGRFEAFLEALRQKGIVPEIRHCSNSACILELPQLQMDMVRAGITLYGIYPSDEMDREQNVLFPAMELISHVSYVKKVPAGTCISYGGTYRTERETQVATIPVGYGDGYPRSLSNRGYVLIDGQRCPILGRVCMDQFMVDVTGMDVKRGDEVVLMGRSKDSFLGVDEVSELSGRFPYEFVCDIGVRVPRIYIDHQDRQTTS